MTTETYAKAREIASRIYDLDFQIKTVKAHKGFCGGKAGTLESPETTESIRVILLADLAGKLEAARAEFAAL